MKQDKIYIGIDPGVKTGYAYHARGEGDCSSMPIHKAMAKLQNLCEMNKKLEHPAKILVIVEDARKRKWYGKNSHAKIQGAGSIKRDCKIWEDFLNDLRDKDLVHGFSMVHPLKGATKLDKEAFAKITGITKRTSEHARDAYMLIHGLK